LSAATVAESFAAAVRGSPEAEFLHVPAPAAAYAPGAVSVGYRDADRRIGALCRMYRAAGYRRGHRVALALDNRADFFLHFLALNRLGISAVPLGGTLHAEEAARLLRHADVALVVCLAELVALVHGARPADCGLAVAPAASAALPAPRREPAAADGEVALLYTSGTSGAPKACILDETYFATVGSHYVGIGGYCAFHEGRDRLITPLPVTHMNALACSLMAMLLTGGCLVQLDRFHPTSWWTSVRSSRATCFHYLGVMPAMLLAAAPSTQDDCSDRLRFGFGAGVDPRHHAAFEARFRVPLIEAWAMTETGGSAWITASEEPRHVGERCFGKPPPTLDWLLVDRSGAQAARGEPGELLVRRRGPDPRRGFFCGYYKDDAATQAAWQGGWFHTGDVARAGADGSLYFVDRLKNVIRRSGENIAAVEVESALLQDEAVAACAVTAIADELRGEEVFAFIVARGAAGPHPDAQAGAALAAAIQARCRARLAYHKIPAYIAFRAQLPQTASQKIARSELQCGAAEAVAIGAAHDLRAAKRRHTRAEGCA